MREPPPDDERSYRGRDQERVRNGLATATPRAARIAVTASTASMNGGERRSRQSTASPAASWYRLSGSVAITPSG